MFRSRGVELLGHLTSYSFQKFHNLSLKSTVLNDIICGTDQIHKLSDSGAKTFKFGVNLMLIKLLAHNTGMVRG